MPLAVQALNKRNGAYHKIGIDSLANVCNRYYNLRITEYLNLILFIVFVPMLQLVIVTITQLNALTILRLTRSVSLWISTAITRAVEFVRIVNTILRALTVTNANQRTTDLTERNGMRSTYVNVSNLLKKL